MNCPLPRYYLCHAIVALQEALTEISSLKARVAALENA